LVSVSHRPQIPIILAVLSDAWSSDPVLASIELHGSVFLLYVLCSPRCLRVDTHPISMLRALHVWWTYLVCLGILDVVRPTRESLASSSQLKAAAASAPLSHVEHAD
jgi:hypothetical protein